MPVPTGLSFEDLHALLEAADSLSGSQTLERTLARILELAAGLIRSEAGSVILHDPQRNDMYFAAAIGPAAANLCKLRVPIEGSKAGEVFRTGQPVVQDALAAHYGKVDAATNFVTHSMICVPLEHDGQRHGVMQILNKAGGQEPFSPHDLELLTRFSRPATMAISRARIFEQLLGSCGLYAKPNVRQDIVQRLFSPESFALTERLTILAIDMRSFSRLCTAIARPLRIQQMLGEYVSMVSSLVVHHDGILNKVMGDGLLAFFRGADGANRAIAAALDVVDQFSPLVEHWADQVNTSIEFLGVGVGLATSDDMVLGSVGDQSFRDVTVVGEAVNLASLLVKIANADRRILCDRLTLRAVRDSVQISGPFRIPTDKSAIVGAVPAPGAPAYDIYSIGRKVDLQVSPKKNPDAAGEYDVFISYRRHGSSGEARCIEQSLKDGCRVFLDVESMPSGHYDESLLHIIAQTPNFLVVLPADALDRTFDPKDFLRLEIEQAIKTERNIVPVFLPGFRFPEPSALPNQIADLVRHDGVEYSHGYFYPTMSKIREHLKLPEPRSKLSTT